MGRTNDFAFDWIDDVLIVKDTVTMYYLKRLLQNALNKLGDVRIDNRVDVARPERDGGQRS